jgi:tetratricopeptide (TPR) repeat protein
VPFGAQSQSAKDTTEVKNMVATAMDLFYAGKLDSSLQLAIQARNIAEKIKYKKGYANALLASGYAYRLKGSYAVALKDFNEALLIFTEIKDDLNTGRTHNFLAQTYQNLGEQKKVIDHLMLAQALVEKKGHQAGLSVIHIDIGNYYSDQGNYELALENFLKSLKASTSIKADSKIAVALNNIGLVYERLQEFDKAIDYYNQSLAITTAANILSKKTLALINIAGLQIMKGELTNAEKNLNEAHRIAGESDDKESLGLIWNKLGDLNFKKGSINKAEEYYGKALSLSRQIQHSDLLMRSLCGISDINLVSKDYASARQNLNEALDIANKLDARDSQKGIYRSLSKLDSAKSEFKNAFVWFQRYVHLNDSLTTQQNASRISFLKSQVAGTSGNIQIAPAPFEPNAAGYFSRSGVQWNFVAIILSVLLVSASVLLIVFGIRLKLKNKAFTALTEELKVKKEAAEEKFI